MTTPDQNLPIKAFTRDFNFYYGSFQALKSINLPVVEKHVTALIEMLEPFGEELAKAYG